MRPLQTATWTVCTLSALALLVSGCAKPYEAAPLPAAQYGKTVVNFWSSWNSDSQGAAIRQMIENFNQAQDTILVRHTFVAADEMEPANSDAIASRQPADVIVSDLASVEKRAFHNQNTNLSRFIEQDPALKDRFYPRLWEAVQYQEEAYALPFLTDTRLLFYNKKAFREAGLDPDTPPKTWDELEQAAIKLDRRNDAGGYERIGFYPLWGSFGEESWMMNADGGRGFFDDNGQLVIHTEAKTEALEWLARWDDRLGQDTIAAVNEEYRENQTNPFLTGKVAIMTEKPAFASLIREFSTELDYGVAPIPERKAGSGHWSTGSGYALEIPQGAKHPEAAWKFIEYLTSAQAQQVWSLRNMEVPANKDVLPNNQMADNPVSQAVSSNLKVTRLLAEPLTAPDFKSVIASQIDEALLGIRSPEEALRNAQSEVIHLMELNREADPAEHTAGGAGIAGLPRPRPM
ncbi:ABC transporter substrate-binding protein [Paenibacillus lutrae]|uniref:Extracellular solute-binding protein n=1 Tax=Paenibacillus lutrae TaxID=2078573 RepID=A0A7X3JZZ2_9BACL|nr:ABC transporter substrate-binding protein [Paenibacillus lutrae]MVP00565.1 extracellular solute-binding protein [Paenibacillus lutrae]